MVVKLFHIFNTVKHGLHESLHVLERVEQLRVLLLKLLVHELLLFELVLEGGVLQTGLGSLVPCQVLFVR